MYVVGSVKTAAMMHACNKTNLMQYLSSVYSVTIPIHVSGLLVAHHQEVTMYICNKLNYQFHPNQASWQSTNAYKTYHLLRIYIFTSWWCATSKPETCRYIVRNKLEINHVSSWFHCMHISICTVNKTTFRCNDILLLLLLSVWYGNCMYASRFCFKMSYIFIRCLIADVMQYAVFCHKM
jgi:hypothetical protein